MPEITEAAPATDLSAALSSPEGQAAIARAVADAQAKAAAAASGMSARASVRAARIAAWKKENPQATQDQAFDFLDTLESDPACEPCRVAASAQKRRQPHPVDFGGYPLTCSGGVITSMDPQKTGPVKVKG